MDVPGKLLGMVVDGSMDRSEEPGINKTTAAVERSGGLAPVPGFIGAGSARAYEVLSHDPTSREYWDDLLIDDRSKDKGVQAETLGTSKIEHLQEEFNPILKIMPPRREDLPPSYTQNLAEESCQGADKWYRSMINTKLYINTMCATPRFLARPNPYKPVSQDNAGLVTKFGRFYRPVVPGLVRINPLSERPIWGDVKTQIIEVPKQVYTTKDNFTLNLTSVIYAHIISQDKVASISNVRQVLVERVQTTLRRIIGARVLQDVVERREEVAQSVQQIIEDFASGWGIQVESMFIKDIVLNNELQDPLSMAAQFGRIAFIELALQLAKFMRQGADILSSALPINSNLWKPNVMLQVKEDQPWDIHDWELPKKDPLFEKLMEKPLKKYVYVWLLMWDINFVPYWIGGGGKFSVALKSKE